MKNILIATLFLVLLVVSNTITWIGTRNNTTRALIADGWKKQGPVNRYTGPDNEVILRRINEIRLENGLSVYSVFSTSDKRHQEALSRYEDICVKGNVSHDDSEGVYTYAGEVIFNAKDNSKTLLEAVNRFLESPTHKEILLSRKHTIGDAWGDSRCLVVLFW